MLPIRKSTLSPNISEADSPGYARHSRTTFCAIPTFCPISIRPPLLAYKKQPLLMIESLFTIISPSPSKRAVPHKSTLGCIKTPHLRKSALRKRLNTPKSGKIAESQLYIFLFCRLVIYVYNPPYHCTHLPTQARRHPLKILSCCARQASQSEVRDRAKQTIPIPLRHLLSKYHIELSSSMKLFSFVHHFCTGKHIAGHFDTSFLNSESGKVST